MTQVHFFCYKLASLDLAHLKPVFKSPAVDFFSLVVRFESNDSLLKQAECGSRGFQIGHQKVTIDKQAEGGKLDNGRVFIQNFCTTKQ